MNIPKDCPRCLSVMEPIAWMDGKVDLEVCPKCSMYKTNNNFGHIISKPITRVWASFGNGTLAWHYNDDICKFSTFEETAISVLKERKDTILPWLPFDITWERLKVLLTFS